MFAYQNFAYQNLLRISMMSWVSAAGSLALRMQPLRAMPLTPVFMISGISSLVMPPMATIGISIFSAFIFWMISRYPSRPRIGESFSLVVVKRNGPQPM